MYYKIYKGNKNNLESAEFAEKHPRRNRIVFLTLLVLAIALNTTYVIKAFNKNPFDKVAILSDIKITAHRGSSLNAPENTMAAFQKAIDDAGLSYSLVDIYLNEAVRAAQEKK